MNRIAIALGLVLAMSWPMARQVMAQEASSQDRAVVSAAAEALEREYAAGPASWRAESNYFNSVENHPAPQAILQQLDDLPRAPIAMEAYIGWQLLSGLPVKVNDELAPRLSQLYHEAPKPVAHPGLDAQSRRQTTALIARLHPKEIEEFNARWQQLVDKRMSDNAMVIKYRDELFAHLPADAQSVIAGFQDGYERASAGVAADTIMSQAMRACQAWAMTDAQPANLNNVEGIVEKLHTLVSARHFPPQYITGARANGKAGAAPTEASAKFVSAKELENLMRTLRDCIANPDSGLKFRGPQ